MFGPLRCVYGDAWRQIGVSLELHKEWGYVAVLNFACGLHANGELMPNRIVDGPFPIQTDPNSDALKEMALAEKNRPDRVGWDCRVVSRFFWNIFIVHSPRRSEKDV